MRTRTDAARRRALGTRSGFTLVEVAASVAILGGVIVGILVARNNALTAHAEANQILACTRLCAGQVAALRGGFAHEGEGVLVTPSGTFEWRITASALPAETAATALTAYEVVVWPVTPAAPAGDAASGDSTPPPTVAPADAECAASAMLWLPAKPAPAQGPGTP
jgi:hypothetical protein